MREECECVALNRISMCFFQGFGEKKKNEKIVFSFFFSLNGKLDFVITGGTVECKKKLEESYQEDALVRLFVRSPQLRCDGTLYL